MNFNWKNGTGALALSSAIALSLVALSVSADAQVAAKPKPGGTKPPVEVAPPRTQPITESGTQPATERGIKDNGVKSCGSCGLTSGKEAAPPPVDDGAAPPSTEFGVDGQILDRGKGRPLSAAKRKGPKVRDDPVSTRSSLLPVLGGLGALAALAAVASGGGDNPVSP